MTGSRSTRAVAWFVIGVAVATFAQWNQLRSVGGDLAFTLRVGTESQARPLIEEELGQIPLTEGLGHDGQYAYLIARDPLGLGGNPHLADDGPYRYRRAMYGWLAGGFGLLPPRAVVFGLSLWAIIGFGAATAVLADIGSLLGARWWAVVGVLGNLGLWLSVQLATADTLAMALVLLAVDLALRRRNGWAIVALAAAALTKDAYLLFAVGLAGWTFLGGRRGMAAAFLLAPAAPLALWAGWLTWQFGGGLSTKENLAAPLAGLIDSVSQWDPGADLVQAVVAVAALVAATSVAVLVRNRLLTWLAMPWVAVALISSEVVWADGNNAVRVFAPLWLVAWLGAAIWVRARATVS